MTLIIRAFHTSLRYKVGKVDGKVLIVYHAAFQGVDPKPPSVDNPWLPVDYLTQWLDPRRSRDSIAAQISDMTMHGKVWLADSSNYKVNPSPLEEALAEYSPDSKPKAPKPKRRKHRQ